MLSLKHVQADYCFRFACVRSHHGLSRRFSDHILPDKIHILNVCFAINGLRENFGGTAGNIAYALSLLGERPASCPRRPRLRPLSDLDDPAPPVPRVRHRRGRRADRRGLHHDRPGRQSDHGVQSRRHETPRVLRPRDGPARETMRRRRTGNLEDMEHLARVWRERGVPYLFDPDSRCRRGPAAAARDDPGALIFISNDYELELTCQKTGRSAEGLLDLTAAVITTRAERGSILLQRENGIHRVEIPAVQPEKIADPTGAGDAYRAGLVKGLTISRGALLHACRMGATRRRTRSKSTARRPTASRLRASTNASPAPSATRHCSRQLEEFSTGSPPPSHPWRS